MHYICFSPDGTLRFSSVGRFTSKKPSVHPERRLDSTVLLLGCSGSYPIAQDGREYILSKGTFQVLFPDTPHCGTGYSDAGQSHFWCHFYLPDGYFITEAEDPGELYGRGLCVLPEFSHIGDHEKYFLLFRQLMDESEKNGGAFGDIVCSAYIKILLCSLSDEIMTVHTDTCPNRALRAELIGWLKQNACEGIGVSDVSERFGYNPDYISRIVKSETGMPLCSYLIHLRLNEAKRLLTDSSLKISEIAYACGFSDEKYFMKVFRKRESMTPSSFRDAYFRVHFN